MSSALDRALRAPLWAHALGLFAVLLALVPLSHVDTVFFADEGSALAQAQQLADGDGWKRPLSFPAADPDSQTFPLFAGDVSGNELAPLGHHAVYAAAVEPWYAVGGAAGAVVLSVVALVLAAYLSGRIAGRVRPRLEVPALWAVGVASPLFFDGYLIVAHTLVAALAAGVTLAFLKVTDGERATVATVVGGVLLFTAGILRNEALLFGAAIALVAFAVGVRVRNRGLIGFALVSGVAVGAARVAESVIRSRIVGQTGSHEFTVASSETGSWIGHHVQSTFITFLLPSYGQFGAGDIVLVLGVTCALVAALIARRRPEDRSGLFLFGGVAVALLLIRLVFTAGPVPGIVWACPLLGVGAVLCTREVVRPRANAMLGGVVVLFVGAVLLTQYASGGVREWGWRYTSLALPIAVPIALVAIVDGAARVSDRDRRLAARLLVAACGLVSVLAFLALRKAKVSAELHIYSTGGHGFGLRPNQTQAPGDWPGRAELWLQARGLLKK